MPTISTRKDGTIRTRFTLHTKNRELYSGKVSRKSVNEFRMKLEPLISAILWLTDLFQRKMLRIHCHELNRDITDEPFPKDRFRLPRLHCGVLRSWRISVSKESTRWKKVSRIRSWGGKEYAYFRCRWSIKLRCSESHTATKWTKRAGRMGIACTDAWGRSTASEVITILAAKLSEAHRGCSRIPSGPHTSLRHFTEFCRNSVLDFLTIVLPAIGNRRAIRVLGRKYVCAVPF